MKTLSFNKDSLHYRLANVYGGLQAYVEVIDFCSYSRKVLLGMFFALMFTVMGGGAGAILGDTFALIAACITTQSLIEPSSLGAVGLGIFTFIGICILVGIAVFIYRRYDDWRDDRKRKQREAAARKGIVYEPPKLSFLVTTYRSFKDKTCFKIDLS